MENLGIVRLLTVISKQVGACVTKELYHKITYIPRKTVIYIKIKQCCKLLKGYTSCLTFWHGSLTLFFFSDILNYTKKYTKNICQDRFLV